MTGNTPQKAEHYPGKHFGLKQFKGKTSAEKSSLRAQNAYFSTTKLLASPENFGPSGLDFNMRTPVKKADGDNQMSRDSNNSIASIESFQIYPNENRIELLRKSIGRGPRKRVASAVEELPRPDSAIQKIF
jgi:hypothetical protein